MQNFLSVLILSSLFIPSLFAKESLNYSTAKPATPSALASKSLLLDIANIQNQKLVTVGQHGHILLSNDGITWQQKNVPVQSTLTSVFFLTEKLGWAVGHDATILHSQDGGETWLIQHYAPSLEKPLFDIFFKNKRQGIAIGAYGLLFRTEDGGESWHNEFHQELLSADDIDYLNELKADDQEGYLDEINFILPHFNQIISLEETLFLVGELGLAAKSDDLGKNWQLKESFYHGSLFSFAHNNQGKIFAAGLRGHVYSKSLQDTLWQPVKTNTTALLNDIVISDKGVLYILGNNGVLLTSNNQGKSFEKTMQPDGKALIAGTWFKGNLFVASEIGIKKLTQF